MEIIYSYFEFRLSSIVCQSGFCFDGAVIMIVASIVCFLNIELGVLINKNKNENVDLKDVSIMDRIEWGKRIYAADPD